VISPQRYEQFARLRDPAYMSALELLADGNGNPAALPTLYAINRESAAEQERIQNDTKLTETQREIEMKKLELEQMRATALALGETLLEEQPVPAAPKTEPKKTHNVAGGENLNRIAQIYGVDPAALRAANPNLNLNNLKPGDKVSVPLSLIYPLPPPN
jgi:LysM repeat protein